MHRILGGSLSLLIVSAAVALGSGRTDRGTGRLQVALVTDGRADPEARLSAELYRDVLREEGYPHEEATVAHLATLTAADLRARYAAVILPDGGCRYVPPSLAASLHDYVVRLGGKLLVVFDAGTLDAKGRYLTRAAFADTTGVEYLLYHPGRERIARMGTLRFTTAAEAAEWEVPPGKLVDGGRLTTGYVYAPALYPLMEARLLEARVAAYDDRDPARPPVLAERKHGAGSATYVAMPLARVKNLSDDLPLRLVLRGFLRRQARLPRVVPAPGGRGTLCFVLQFGSAAHVSGWDRLVAREEFPYGLPCSYHVAAGPSLAREGDGRGFDASDPLSGGRVLRTLRGLGEFGAHGGWLPDEWAREAHRMGREQVEERLRRNFAQLEVLTGGGVRAFSAPCWNHPDWINEPLESRGLRAFYNVRDSGSSPHRPWMGGKRTAGSMWSFPVAPFGPRTTFGEMTRDGVPAEEVRRWLTELAGYVADHRTVRTIGGNPLELLAHGEAMKAFWEEVDRLRADGRLEVAPLGSTAAYLDRQAKTDLSVEERPDGWSVAVSNPEGLMDLTIALPLPSGIGSVRAEGDDLDVEIERGWAYVRIGSPGFRREFGITYP